MLPVPVSCCARARPGGNRNDTALHPVAEDPVCADVLAAAAAPANARGTAHDLRHQAIHVAGARQVMTMAAMIAEDQVAVLQVPGDGNPGKLLADTGMHRAEKFALGK